MIQNGTHGRRYGSFRTATRSTDVVRHELTPIEVNPARWTGKILIDKVCAKENNPLYLPVCLFLKGIIGTAKSITMRLSLEGGLRTSPAPAPSAAADAGAGDRDRAPRLTPHA
ncbi:hypothetical protein EVAR_78812_1 [Eumeta japonica]|uniref:Uncharacterized protein n=1 Tax=Eumeta variegata TaxID=151549 RepID=A0A4C1T2G9_EUMVA|nr:hypothetical protein EVAR_78812_1 [Eumeta japonica]